MSQADAIPRAAVELVSELVVGHHILFRHKVVDAFGHLSVRHNKEPERYLMARHLAPGLVTENDVVTFDLDSTPIVDVGTRYDSERFIHGEIYKARPDVAAIVHCHAAPLIPFAATRTPLRPVDHRSGFLAGGVPVFDIRDAGGTTDMLVRTPELGGALARALGNKPMILMRGGGAILVGGSIRQVVYRAIYAAENAKLQMNGSRLGEVTCLDDEESVRAAEAMDDVVDRTWALWTAEVAG